MWNKVYHLFKGIGNVSSIYLYLLYLDYWHLAITLSRKENGMWNLLIYIYMTLFTNLVENQMLSLCCDNISKFSL